MTISNLKISQRLYLVFSLVIALLCSVIFVGVSRLYLLNDEIDLTVHDRYQKIYVLNEAIKGVNLQARNLRNILLMTDDNEIKSEIASIHKVANEIEEDLNKLSSSVQNPKAKELLDAVLDARAQFLAGRNKLIQLVQEGKKRRST